MIKCTPISIDNKISDMRHARLVAFLKSKNYEIITENHNNKLVYHSGANKQAPICNFKLIPIEKVQDDEGNDKSYSFYIHKSDNKDWYLVELDKDDLANSRWIKKCNPFLTLYGKEKESYQKLLELIDDVLCSLKIDEVIEYSNIGWINHKGKWVFLSSDEVIGDINDNIRSITPGFNLSNADINEELAFHKSYEMLDICNRETTLPLFAYTLVSLLTTPLSTYKELTPTFSMWLYGFRGQGKTSISVLFTKIYETLNLIRVDSYRKEYKEKNKRFKDCVFIIDDYGIAKSTTSERLVAEKVENIIRAVGDRHQLADDTYIGDGMVLFTGEKFLGYSNDSNTDFRSSISRCFRVEMDNIMNEELEDFDPLKKERLIHFSKNNYLGTSIGYYIQWLAEKLNNGFLDQYLAKYKRYSEDVRKINMRHVNSYSHLMSSFDSYLEYALEKGFIKFEEYQHEMDGARNLLCKLSERQKEPVLDKGITIFFKAFKSLIVKEQILIDVDKLIFNSRFSKDNWCGTLYIESGILEVYWSKLYSKVKEYVKLNMTAYVEDLPDIKLLGKRLKGADYIVVNDYDDRDYLTSPKRFFIGNVAKNIRVAELKGELIPEIIGAIKLQNDYENIVESINTYGEYDDEHEYESENSKTYNSISEILKDANLNFLTGSESDEEE